MRDLAEDLRNINQALDIIAKETPNDMLSGYVRVLNTWKYAIQRAVEAEKKLAEIRELAIDPNNRKTITTAIRLDLIVGIIDRV